MLVHPPRGGRLPGRLTGSPAAFGPPDSNGTHLAETTLRSAHASSTLCSTGGWASMSVIVAFVTISDHRDSQSRRQAGFRLVGGFRVCNKSAALARAGAQPRTGIEQCRGYEASTSLFAQSRPAKSTLTTSLVFFSPSAPQPHNPTCWLGRRHWSPAPARVLVSVDDKFHLRRMLSTLLAASCRLPLAAHALPTPWLRCRGRHRGAAG